MVQFNETGGKIRHYKVLCAQMYDVCLSVWSLPNVYVFFLSTCLPSSYLYDVFSTTVNCVMSAYRHDVFLPVWCLLICMLCVDLYDVCLPVLYDVWLPVWSLLMCMMSVQLCDVCLPVYDVCSTVSCLYLSDVFIHVWCLLSPCMMSSYLYNACVHVWRLLNWMMSAYLYDVYSTGYCMPAYMISSYKYNVCYALWYLPTCIMSARHVKCLLIYVKSAYLYDGCSTVRSLPALKE